MKYYGLTDIGMQRKENQDKIYLPDEDSKIQLFIVADGMGGAKAGGTASKMAIEYVRDYIINELKNLDDARENIENLLKVAIISANNYVYAKSKENKEYSGMGTTLSIALIIKNKVFVGHIGDSRIYRLRKQIMRQLTKDHSYVQALVASGEITKEEAQNHPQKNILLKVLGCERDVEPDVFVRGFLKDDIIMMCTDGLTNMVEIDEIHEKITDGKDDVKKVCEDLVQTAKENGGYDNISVILISND